MIKFIRTSILLPLIICLSLVSCNDWLNINDNPNTTQNIEAKYLFNYAATLWSGSRTGGDFYIPLSQSIQNQADGDRWVFYGSYYNVSTQAGNTWNSRYTNIGNNLQLAMKQLADNNVPLPNAIAQCKILLAMQVYETTMLFGGIPFSEAWNENIKYPKFDAQKDVLNGVISMLNEAIEKIDLSDKNCIDEYDSYFKGDMSKWLAIAHSLKFRTLMVMVDTEPDKAKEIGQMLQAKEMISSPDNNMEFKYASIAGNENPKYSLIQALGGKNSFLFAHISVISPMEAYDDARMSSYFTPCSDGKFRGLSTQEFYKTDAGETKDVSMVSDYLLRANCPDLIYSYQEQLLLEAEAYARGLGVTQNLGEASRLYKSGVKAACDYYEVSPIKTSDFINRLPDLSSQTEEEALHEIYLQQWIDLMDRPFEAFVQWRRSGIQGKEIPSLTVPPFNSHPGLIRRWEYPGEELNSNPNAPKNSPNLWENMWFDL